jgi:hypothetical protein
LLKANELDPDDPGIVNGLAVFYILEKKCQEALPHAARLVELLPSAAGPRQMLQQIQAALSSRTLSP